MRCKKYWKPLKRAAGIFVCSSLVTGALILSNGCDIINPSDPVPSYIRVDSIGIDPVPGTGTSQQKFTEVWVFLNTSLVGAYSIPATIPVIAEGQNELLLFPGIRVNGILSAADFYPFYESFTAQPTLVPGEVTTLQMRTRYRSNAVIAYNEDFESAHRLTDDLDGDPGTSVQRVMTGAFEGTGSGRIALTDSADFIQVATVPLLTSIPTNGTPVFVELHYKNTAEFSVGLVGHAPNSTPASVAILVLRPQSDWNKVYIDLVPALRASQLQGYQILITAAHDGTQEVSEILLDNLKVVHIAQ
jgi:hypothetical protein